MRTLEIELPEKNTKRRIFIKRSNAQGGFSLVDMLVATGAAGFLIATVMTSFVVLWRAFNALGNYAQLSRTSRVALDCMARDIRQAGGLTNWSGEGLWFTNLDGSPLTYLYNSTNGTLSYTNGATGQYGVLLTNCAYLQFSLFQRRPTNGTMNFYAASNATSAKVIEVNFTCTRTNYPSLTDCEGGQTAKIVMRN